MSLKNCYLTHCRAANLSLGLLYCQFFSQWTYVLELFCFGIVHRSLRKELNRGVFLDCLQGNSKLSKKLKFNFSD